MNYIYSLLLERQVLTGLSVEELKVWRQAVMESFGEEGTDHNFLILFGKQIEDEIKIAQDREFSYLTGYNNVNLEGAIKTATFELEHIKKKRYNQIKYGVSEYVISDKEKEFVDKQKKIIEIGNKLLQERKQREDKELEHLIAVQEAKWGKGRVQVDKKTGQIHINRTSKNNALTDDQIEAIEV